MATECVKVKEEPLDLSEVTQESRIQEAEAQNGPQFINIKTELDTPSIRIKTEPSEEVSPEEECNDSWNVPITQTHNILPNNCLEVQIKIEPEDSNLASDQPLAEAATTSYSVQEPCEKNSLVCPVCYKSFANPGNVQRHMLLHTKQRYHCTECPKEFLSKELFDKHINKHGQMKIERPFTCDICDKTFKSTSNLMQHKKTHLDVKPFICPLCHKTFAFKANLAKHQGKSRCKRPREDPITCHVCNKVFQKEFLLKSHLRRHDTDRPFACDQCTMAFKYKSTLIRHIQLHNGVRPYSCPVCNKTFTHSGLLKPHMRVHTGEKPYQCPICQKYFAHKHNMQRHAGRHNKIKHLKCDVCHKTFPKESRLKYHMKTHSNEKYFSCHVCPKRFSHKQNVLRHYRRKHPNSTYEGTETDASVALKLWDTIKSKYSDDPEEILG